MCIGLHLAMTEMTCLIAAVYGNFETSIAEKDLDASPAITSRFETFADERFMVREHGDYGIGEHRCRIQFKEVKVT